MEKKGENITRGGKEARRNIKEKGNCERNAEKGKWLKIGDIKGKLEENDGQVDERGKGKGRKMTRKKE